MLAEFNGDILSNNQRLIALDVSHNQITTLKLNEVNIDCTVCLYIIFCRQLRKVIR